MAGTLIQVRIDDNLKSEATNIFDKLGIDISTAIRMFLKRSVQENGIPFSMKLEAPSVEKDILQAMQTMSSEAKKYGSNKMSLNQINSEIKKARKSKWSIMQS